MEEVRLERRVTMLRGVAVVVLALLSMHGTAAAKGWPLRYHNLDPCRVVDTREPAGPGGGPALYANTERSFPVKGLCGVPEEAYAVSLNITVVQATSTGDLRLFEAGIPAPTATVASFDATRTRANNGIVALGNVDGNHVTAGLTLQSGEAGQAHLVLDINGYFEMPTVWVSTFGSDANPGTCARPLRSIRAAIDLAAPTGKAVAVMTGAYHEESTITLASGVSVLGGFRQDCQWYEADVATILVSSPTAISASGITAPTMLEQLEIIGASNRTAGGSAYGILAVNSPGLTIQSCRIVAGDGGDGTRGSSGSAGGNGGGGSPGLPGCENGTGTCRLCGQPQGGSGGSSPPGPTALQGGAGGASGLGCNQGSSGYSGYGTAGGAGGMGGLGCSVTGDGSYGLRGPDGLNGNNGSGGGASGVIAIVGYVPAPGGAGGTGASGSGGGGGGGGGGGNVGTGVACPSYGSSGGGGGGGGRGGTGAAGGTGGGGSFAVYLWASSVRIKSSELVTGYGGDGGDGGIGGNGGSGGAGGAGGPYGGLDDQHFAGMGAAGGAGGDGGHGGHGGGGGGGPSVGVLSGDSSAPTLESNTFSLGLAGSGGWSLGNSGNDGLRAETNP